MIRWSIRTGTVVLAAAAGAMAGPEPLRWWSPDTREQQVALEDALRAAVSEERLAATHEALGSEPHLAGTPGGWRVAEWIAAEFEAAGLDVERQELWIYLPVFERASVEVLAPERIDLPLSERAVEGDAFAGHDDATPGWNAWSGSGVAEGEVVYANYGTKSDFERLATMGVNVRGKIVIARYGGNFRGYKAKFAEAAGAAGLIIYSDPADSGYAKGLVHPEGGWANEWAIQRGSILTLPYSGDPLTPGWPAVKDANRIEPGLLDLPKIPVQPMGYAAASEILSRMRGEVVPAGWQGGLPFTYRVTGGDGLRVRVEVRQRRELQRVINVVGTLVGTEKPEEVALIGSHHDAWLWGADDPLSGTIVTIEAARAFGDAARQGLRPRRSVSFCAWDAEEFGIMGSVEWVEAHAERLSRGGLGYFNLDASVSGFNFGATASPSLRRLVGEAADAVADPRNPSRTLLEGWRERANVSLEEFVPTGGTLGGGSDHVGFLCRAGVPSAGMGMNSDGAPSGGTAYHSAYDNLSWYPKVVEGYDAHAALTKVVVTAASRLANAEALPLAPADTMKDASRLLRDVGDRSMRAGLALDFSGLTDRFDALQTSLAASSDAIAARLAAGEWSEEQLEQINDRLIALDRAWIYLKGLPGRDWFRNLFAAPDEDSGYASWPMPAMRRAIERADQQALREAWELHEFTLRNIESIAQELKDLTRPDAP